MAAERGSIEPLLDFIPRIHPQWNRPDHLAPIAELFERALTEQVRALVSVPPQHGKTETCKHGLAWYMAQRPGSRSAFVSYAAGKSEDESVSTQWIADEAGMEPAGRRGAWKSSNGAQLVAPGIGGPLTGYGIDGILLVDDPHKGPRDTSSATLRQHVIDWFNTVALTRLHPGASVIVVHTRWHPDDLIGHLAKRGGWEVVNLPAIREDEDGNESALWPEQRPLEFLRAARAEITDFEWASLYQGRPRPKGGTVFSEPRYYDEIPGGAKAGHGCDLAYTAKTYSDYSVIVTMMRSGATFYVVDVVRSQCEAPDFAKVINDQVETYGGTVQWHASGTEKGVAQFVQKLAKKLEYIPATTDKFQRAQPVAGAWNDGRVLLPKEAPWLGTFLSEVGNFTGVADAHDDQVDALSSAFSALNYATAPAAYEPPGASSGSRWGSSRGFG